MWTPLNSAVGFGRSALSMSFKAVRIDHIIHSTGRIPMTLTMKRSNHVVFGSVRWMICAPVSPCVVHSNAPDAPIYNHYA